MRHKEKQEAKKGTELPKYENIFRVLGPVLKRFGGFGNLKN